MHPNESIYAAIAFLAISMTPSKVSAPPMNPLAWQKVHPSMPATLLSSESRTPRHASGSDFRFSKLSGETGTHWMRHFELGASDSG